MTTWPSSSGGSSSPPDFTAHALSRPPRKKPEPFSQPGRQPERDQQKLRNTSDPVGARNAEHITRPADTRGAVHRGGPAVGRWSSRPSSDGGVVVEERRGRACGAAEDWWR